MISGSLVMGSTPMLLRVLEALGPAAQRPVVLDTGGLVLIDSWGIQAISELQHRLIEAGWDASVRCGDGPAHDVFAVMGSRRVSEAAVSALGPAVVSFGRRPLPVPLILTARQARPAAGAPPVEGRSHRPCSRWSRSQARPDGSSFSAGLRCGAGPVASDPPPPPFTPPPLGGTGAYAGAKGSGTFRQLNKAGTRTAVKVNLT